MTGDSNSAVNRDPDQPRDSNLFDAVFLALDPGDICGQDGPVLHGVEVSPRARSRVVEAAARSAVRTRESPILVEPKHDLDLALVDARVDVSNEPRGLVAKKLRVEVSVAHPRRSCSKATVRYQNAAYAAIRRRSGDSSKLRSPL